MPEHDETKVRQPGPAGLMVVDIGDGNTLLSADPIVKALARMLLEARWRIVELEREALALQGRSGVTKVPFSHVRIGCPR